MWSLITGGKAMFGLRKVGQCPVVSTVTANSTLDLLTRPKHSNYC